MLLFSAAAGWREGDTADSGRQLYRDISASPWNGVNLWQKEIRVSESHENLIGRDRVEQ